MEMINGSTVIPQSDVSEPVSFGATQTDRAYRVLVGAIPAGEPAPPLHVHPYTDEAFYISGGEATFLLGDRETRVTAGGFVFLPRGTPHTAWNSGDDPMLGLIIASPGGAENVFEPAGG